MQTLKGKSVVVTGGSRGLGKGVVATMIGQGADVWAVARDADRLKELTWEHPSVRTIALDIAKDRAAETVLDQVKPDVLILCGGATPRMAPVQEQSWDEFSRVWNTDVKASFEFGKAALTTPMAPGSEVVIVSSGAAISGSFMSGGYAGAKRMQWMLADYLQKESDALGRDIRFRALLPKQIVGETALGHEAARGYANRQGITKEKFLERFGTPLTPDGFGNGVSSLILDEAYRSGIGFTITGDGLEAIG